MVMLVDPTQERTALQSAQRNPVQGFDPGFIERFKADYSSMMDYSNVNARERSRADVQSEFISRFYQESGIGVRNWLTGPGLKPRADLEANARGQFDAWKKENPESDLVFPDEAIIEKQTMDRANAARQNSVKLQGLSTSWGSAIGGFAGTAAGALRDPINAISLSFGAGAASGIIRTALVEGAIGIASETAIQGFNYGFKQGVDPNFGFRDAIYEIGAAGAGGAALGGGIKGLAAAWHRAKVGEWPRHTVDAGNLVTREASVPASRLDKSAQGASVYRGAVEKAADDLFRGNPVEIPQEAFMQANARPGRIYDADGRSVGVQYEVIEADDLITSNLDDMSINPAFPAELQPRDRTRAISQDQINSIAANLQPERLGPSADAANGAPVVGPEGFVESGNGRVMAMRRAYMENGPASESYRNFLRSQNFDIEGFNKPVLIARRITDLDSEARIGFVTAANRSTAMRLGAAEQALSDARLIDDAVLSKLRDAGDVDTVSNRDFVRGFMQKLPRAEQGELVDASGALSQNGERRIMAALMGRAYGEPSVLGRALEDSDSNIKSLAGALGDSAGSWSIMRDAVVRGDIPRGMDITADLMDAVNLVMRARDEGRPVADLINQAEMFGGPNEIAKILARAMFGDENLKRAISRKRLTSFLRDYADEALKNDSGARLFGEPLESSDVLRNSLAKADREDLIAVANDRLTPENIEAMAKANDTSDAVLREAIRIGEEMPDIKVDLGDGAGERSISEIMAEADAEIKAASDIEACTLGNNDHFRTRTTGAA
ncbi:hypothetical protein ACJKIH_02960 [Brucella pseudogrignonensis]|uniref:hypothetical protein n=1 Tax=Brucella pseudogrignonensis TaxID=419475 RepID=UPI0038B58243